MTTQPAEGHVLVPRERLVETCRVAARAAGASPEQAAVLAETTVQAEERGRHGVGVSHLLDYLDGFARGRISADPPETTPRGGACVSVDCKGGLAQHGFESVLPWLTESATSHGLAATMLHHSFTAGELAFYVRALAGQGLIGLAFANSPALVAVAGSQGPLLGTNPMAFAVPLANGQRIVVDQASSVTAWVAIREAQERGAELSPGMAVDATGAPTTSPGEALAGALLPFGGYKGGNIALLVELLAVLAGGRASLDVASFDRGEESPGVGVFVVAFDPETLNPGARDTLTSLVARWAEDRQVNTEVWTSDSPLDPIPVAAHLLDVITSDG